MNARLPSRSSALRRASPLCFLIELLVLAACSDGTTEPDPTPVPVGLEVEGPTQRLTIGRTDRLRTTVSSSKGGAMTGQPIRFASRDTTTFTVDSTGVVTGVGAGEAWAVVTTAQFRDSALIEVAFDLLPGEARTRLRTQGTDRTVILPQAMGVFADYVARSDGDYWLIAGNNAGTSRDTAVVVLLPTDSTTDGRRIELTTWHPSLLDTTDVTKGGRPLAFLWWEDSDSWTVVPLQGWIEFKVDEALPEPGTRTVLSHARLVASGDSYRQVVAGEASSPWASVGKTVDLVADLRPAVQHSTLGWSSGQIVGFGQPITWSFGDAYLVRTGWNGRPFSLYIDGSPDIALDLPGMASVDIGTLDQTTRAYLSINDYATGYRATSTSGKVEITRYVPPPAPDLWGEVEGKVTAHGTGSDAKYAPFSFDTQFDFHAPVEPPESSAGPESSPATRGVSSIQDLRKLFPGLALLDTRTPSPSR